MTDLVTRRQRRIVTLALVVVLGVLLLPYVWLILTSFKDRVDIFNGDPFAAFAPTLENYRVAFAEKGFLKQPGQLLDHRGGGDACWRCSSGVPAAYALSRTRGRGGAIVLFVLLAARLMPAIVLAVPLFILFADLKLLGTYPAPVIAHLTFLVPFVTWMMRGFFLAVPRGAR